MAKAIRILFLDDDDERHRAVDRFFAHRGEFEVNHVWTARNAIAALQDRRYFLVCLDHDLEKSHERLIGVPYETGLVVAERIGFLPRNRLPAWVHVHSHNEIGRERMAAAVVNGAPGVKVTMSYFAPSPRYWAMVARFALKWCRS